MKIIRSLFMSRREKEAQQKVRFRKAQSRIKRHVEQLRKSADRYWTLAERAYALSATQDFDNFGSQHVRLVQSMTRWQCFLLKLESLELHRDEVIATSEFMNGLNSAIHVIMHGATPIEISKLSDSMELALERARDIETELDELMSSTGASLENWSPDVQQVPAQPTMANQIRSTEATNEVEMQKFNEAMKQLQLRHSSCQKQ